ncbi:MAG: cupin domain-containing protein [Myxococcales bacterium]
MPVIQAPPAHTHELPHARFRSIATPSLGSRENSIWRVELLGAGQDSPPHSLTREEIFVVLAGSVRVVIAGVASEAQPGDAIVVPPDTELVLGPVTERAELLCCLPVGGQGRIAGGDLFTPPWAL